MFGVGAWQAKEEPEQVQEEKKRKKGGGFQSLGLEKPLFNAIQKMGYNVPTPIQRKAIPPLMQGTDVVAMARTGSGKTAAFLIPLMHHLKEHSKIVGIRGLVLSPTRELTLQILRFGLQLNKFMDLKFAAVVGGNSLDQQFEYLAGNPDIVVATPGRILHIMEEASVKLQLLRCIVLDEADRLFEMGLQPQIVAIMQRIPENCQRSLFSATMPSVLAEFTNAGLHNPVVIRLDAEMKLSDKLKQNAFVVRHEEKMAALIVILRRVIAVGEKKSDFAQALVFVESKHHVETLQMVLESYMITCSAVHGNMDQEARRLAVQRFSKRETSVMVVTDVAARGLDIPLLDNVINYSFPYAPKLFVHRVGRVARAGRSGTAYSILTYEDFPFYVDLMNFIEKPLVNRKEEGDLFFTADDGCFGRMPEEELHIELDYIRRLADTDVEVRNMMRVADHAHQKYTRTRRKATHDGIQDAKQSQYQFSNVAIHPLFLDQLDQRRVDANLAKQELRRFKAKETILDLRHGEKVFDYKKPVTLQDASSALLKEKLASAEEAAGTAAEEEEASVQTRGKLGASSKESTGVASKKSSSSAATGTAKASPLSRLTLAETLLLKAQQRKREREGIDTDLGMTGRYDSGSIGGPRHERTISGGAVVTVSRAANSGKADVNELFSSDPSTNPYRDQDFFMDTVRRETADNVHYSVKDATFDISAESATEEAQKRTVFAWSKKKNRYVQMNVNEAKAMMLGMRNEAGKQINFKTKLDAYHKWTKKSNMRIQDCGEEEDLGPLHRARAAAQNEVELVGDGAENFAGGEEEPIDLSDPNNGKKARIGRKQKRLPKDGRVRTFEEMALAKRKVQRESDRIARKRARKGQRK